MPSGTTYFYRLTARNFIGEPELPLLDLLGWLALAGIVAGAAQTTMVLWQAWQLT